MTKSIRAGDIKLDEQAAALLAAAEIENAPSWNTLPIAEARKVYVAGCRAGVGEAIAVDRVEDLSLALSGRTIGGRLYCPSTAKASSLLIHFHGGGFVLGNLDSHDNLCRRLCRDSGLPVLAVDYRLAPEHPFPAAIDDAFDSICWVQENAAALGWSGKGLVLSGDSAGATLVAVASVRLRDRGLPAAQAQVLLYPVLDTAMDTPSYRSRGEGYRLTQTLMSWFLDLYLPDRDTRTNPEASPLRTADLSKLPSALVVTAGYDPLCDEGKAYAVRLKESGNQVEHLHFPSMIHSFCNMFDVLDEGASAMDTIAQWIRERAKVAT